MPGDDKHIERRQSLKSANTCLVQPRISLLGDEWKHRVHENSLSILSSVGVEVHSDRMRQMLEDAVGFSVAGNGRVTMPRELVEWALDAAPSTLDVYDRLGNHAFRLGDGVTRFGIGVTNLYYQQPETNTVTPFTADHMEMSVRLSNSLSSFEIVSTIGVLQEVPPSRADLDGTLRMVANTVKPLVILVSDERQFPLVLDMLEHLVRDLAAKPFVIPYFNPITPLIINEETGDRMLHAIDRGLPIIYSNLGMAGSSTPITPAGSLVLLNAELLAGLTVSQLAREGTPVILGSLPMFFDMGAMLPVYDLLSVLLNLACAEMMAHYQLPHCGTSGSGDGWGPDPRSNATAWANALTSCLHKVGLCPFVGSNFGGMAFSPTSSVYANEIIAQARGLAAGFPLSDESLSLADIEKAGPGGSFLASRKTFELFRDAHFRSDIFPNLSLEGWEEKGRPNAADLLRERTLELLRQPAIPGDYAELMVRGDAYIRQVTA
ncbi:MAG: trimethylamine methyltransferase family protein [bacterium]